MSGDSPVNTGVMSVNEGQGWRSFCHGDLEQQAGRGVGL